MIIKKTNSVLETVDFLAKGYRPACGFTNIYPNLQSGKLPDEDAKFVDISGIKTLAEVREYDDTIAIGGAVNFQFLADYFLIDFTGEFGALRQAAASVGGPQTRNRATIGGNMADASPSADSVPALLVLGGHVELMSPRGVRIVALADFFQGYRKTALASDELITGIFIKRQGGKSTYKKIGRRKAMAIAVAGMAAWVKIENGTIEKVRLAMSSVAPTAVRLIKAEEYLTGKKPSAELFEEAAKLVKENISPMTDLRATAAYRCMVSENLLVSCLKEITGVEA